MKAIDRKDYIMVIKERDDSEKSLKQAFKIGTVTLMVDKVSKEITGIKIWKVKAKAK